MRLLLKTSMFLILACFAATASWSQEARGSEVEIEPITGEHFREVLTGLQGKHVLVNLWASWCLPCIRELPDLEELQKEHDPNELRVITVTMDHPSKRPEAEKLAAELTPTLESYSRDGDYIAFPEAALSWEWDGTLPTTFLLDQEGTITEVFTGTLGEDDLEVVEDAVRFATRVPAGR